MNYNKKTKVELIELLELINSTVSRGLAFCNNEKEELSGRLGYALGTLEFLNEELNEVKNKQKQDKFIKSLTEKNKLQLTQIFELKEKLEEAKEWLIDCVEFQENHSDLERYMKKVWNYERK